jgi:YegS/Rv2252/BmrU family lipid kinase
MRLIYNPVANHGLSAPRADDFRRLAAERGFRDWVVTDRQGHAAELVAAAAREGIDAVIALGGDGTVHEAVNGLMQVDEPRRPRLGVVPLGSGNDFVGSLGLPLDPLSALRAVFESRADKSVDLGWIRDGAGRSEYWCNALGIGFDAAITIQSRTISRLHGFAMYFAAVLKTIALKYERPTMDLDIDGATHTGKFLMLTIGNGTREGGGFRTTPDARMDDGWLDYLLVDPIPRLRMLRLIPEVMRGTHGRFPEAHLGRFRTLRLRSDRALPVQTDGELFGVDETDIREVEVRIVPSAVRVIAGSC